jgi:hypothetical protein
MDAYGHMHLHYYIDQAADPKSDRLLETKPA